LAPLIAPVLRFPDDARSRFAATFTPDAERLVALGRNHARQLPAVERVAAEIDLILT
jgi:hypothetical protein